MRRSSVLLVTLLGVAALVSFAGSATAHSELEGAKPKPNARLAAAPRTLTLSFTEVPSKDSVVKVADGCKSDVVTGSTVTQNSLDIQLATGQPGRWKVAYRVISAEDGHLTQGTYSFEVSGTKDCSKGDGGSDKNDGGNGGPAATPDEGSDFPVVPVVIAAVVIVWIGIVVRRVSAR